MIHLAHKKEVNKNQITWELRNIFFLRVSVQDRK